MHLLGVIISFPSSSHDKQSLYTQHLPTLTAYLRTNFISVFIMTTTAEVKPDRFRFGKCILLSLLVILPVLTIFALSFVPRTTTLFYEPSAAQDSAEVPVEDPSERLTTEWLRASPVLPPLLVDRIGHKLIDFRIPYLPFGVHIVGLSLNGVPTPLEPVFSIPIPPLSSPLSFSYQFLLEGSRVSPKSEPVEVTPLPDGSLEAPRVFVHGVGSQTTLTWPHEPGSVKYRVRCKTAGHSASVLKDGNFILKSALPCQFNARTMHVTVSAVTSDSTKTSLPSRLVVLRAAPLPDTPEDIKVVQVQQREVLVTWNYSFRAESDLRILKLRSWIDRFLPPAFRTVADPVGKFLVTVRKPDQQLVSVTKVLNLAVGCLKGCVISATVGGLKALGIYSVSVKAVSVSGAQSMESIGIPFATGTTCAQPIKDVRGFTDGLGLFVETANPTRIKIEDAVHECLPVAGWFAERNSMIAPTQYCAVHGLESDKVYTTTILSDLSANESDCVLQVRTAKSGKCNSVSDAAWLTSPENTRFDSRLFTLQTLPILTSFSATNIAKDLVDWSFQNRKTFDMDKPLTLGCATCFSDSRSCMLSNCWDRCFAPTSEKCHQCHMFYCLGYFQSCTGIQTRKFLPPTPFEAGK